MTEQQACDMHWLKTFGPQNLLDWELWDTPNTFRGGFARVISPTFRNSHFFSLWSPRIKVAPEIRKTYCQCSQLIFLGSKGFSFTNSSRNETNKVPNKKPPPCFLPTLGALGSFPSFLGIFQQLPLPSPGRYAVWLGICSCSGSMASMGIFFVLNIFGERKGFLKVLQLERSKGL